MPEPPYRALSILLRLFSLLTALGGLLLIFAEKPLIVRILLRPPEGEVSTLFLSTLKEIGCTPQKSHAVSRGNFFQPIFMVQPAENILGPDPGGCWQLMPLKFRSRE